MNAKWYNYFRKQIGSISLLGIYPEKLKCVYTQIHIEKFITVFQPHTYSRTALLMQDFLECFKDCAPLIIYKTFPARESFYKDGSAKTLYKNLKEIKENQVFYADTKTQLISILNEVSCGYKKIVFLGAGNIYDLVKSLVKN